MVNEYAKIWAPAQPVQTFLHFNEPERWKSGKSNLCSLKNSETISKRLSEYPSYQNRKMNRKNENRALCTYAYNSSWEQKWFHSYLLQKAL
jgi:hypothetical protein